MRGYCLFDLARDTKKTYTFARNVNELSEKDFKDEFC